MLEESNGSEGIVIRVIDDQAEVRAALALLLECDGREVLEYDSAEAFLEKDCLSRPGCVLSDIRMPGMSGLELQGEMIRRGIALPLIFITGHGDIEMAVDAVLAGAFDFLEKPVKEARLFMAIEKALAANRASEASLQQRLILLSTREREVLRLMLHAVGTHAIAERFRISERTVQGHRWRIYQKLGINSPEKLRTCIRPEDL